MGPGDRELQAGAPRAIPGKFLVRLGGGVDILLGLAFAGFEVRLPPARGFGRAGAGLDLGLLRKIAPAGVAVFRALAHFVLLHRGLGIALAPDDLDHSPGLVGPDVVTDDGVGESRLVARQEDPRVQSKLRALWRTCLARGLSATEIIRLGLCLPRMRGNQFTVKKRPVDSATLYPCPGRKHARQ
jgi:hypothetical protein